MFQRIKLYSHIYRNLHIPLWPLIDLPRATFNYFLHKDCPVKCHDTQQMVLMSII